MATTKVKSTYSLNEETVRTLERLAERLRVSRSEALERAIHHLARQDLTAGDLEEKALDELQRRLHLTTPQAEAWESQVRQERVAAERE